MSKNIKIKFIDVNQMFDSPIFGYPKLAQFLKSNPGFEYESETKIRDFFHWIISNSEIDIRTTPLNDENIFFLLKGEIRGRVDGGWYNLNPDFLFEKYIENNSIKDELELEYIIGVGGGWFGELTKSIKIYINSDEQRHADCPHVHIQKGKYKQGDSYSNTIRVKIDEDLTVMDNKKVTDVFSKREWKDVQEFLKSNRNIFMENFNLIVKGVKPVESWLDTDNGEVLFR